MLMARRLLEAGVTFVKVGSYGWDTHGDHFNGALNLHPIAAEISLVHRRDDFRAAPDSVNKMRELVEAGKMTLHIADLKGLHGDRRFNHGAFAGDELPIAVRKLVQDFRHLAEMEGRVERRDLFQQPVCQVLPRNYGPGGNVVNRFFGVEFGALAARLIQNIDQMGLHIEKAEFEHREKPDWPRADDNHIRLVPFGLEFAHEAL